MANGEGAVDELLPALSASEEALLNQIPPVEIRCIWGFDNISQEVSGLVRNVKDVQYVVAKAWSVLIHIYLIKHPGRQMW
jgi:hypothetical protein